MTLNNHVFYSSMFQKKFAGIFNRYKTFKKIFSKKKLNVIDVGANNGQTIIEFSKNFPGSTIHSFEPQEECRLNLIKIKRKNKKLKIHLNFFALGEKKKIKIFYKNSKTNLSSFFKVNISSKLFINMKKLRKNEKFISGINLPIKIQQNTLSNYFKTKKIKNVDILKIDTQGYDEYVLKGLKNKDLNKIKIIVLEMNFYDFYEKSNSFLKIEKIIGNHFNFWDISFLYKNPKFNSIDYMDVVYINKNYQKKIIS